MLYARPRSRFVAQFLGHANMLPVTLRDRVDGAYVVDSPWGRFSILPENVAAELAATPGARALAVVRPEHLSIVDAAAGVEAGGMKTNVTQALFNGSETIYRVTCRVTGLSLTVMEKRPGSRLYDIGDDMLLGVDPAYLVVVPDTGGVP
jgi:ABC-type Fe3+/spermidine/putrescine transport system ATPase subunit